MVAKVCSWSMFEIMELKKIQSHLHDVHLAPPGPPLRLCPFLGDLLLGVVRPLENSIFGSLLHGTRLVRSFLLHPDYLHPCQDFGHRFLKTQQYLITSSDLHSCHCLYFPSHYPPTGAPLTSRPLISVSVRARQNFSNQRSILSFLSSMNERTFSTDPNKYSRVILV